MALIRIHVGFTPSQLKALDKHAAELALDRSNFIRYCVARTIKEEAKKKQENSIA